MVHTYGTYQRYVTDSENEMTARTLPRTPEVSYERAAAGMAAASRPMPLGAWREVSRTGTVAGDPDPDATAVGLVRRWHQHLAVAIDLPMERLAPGAERLAELQSAWLDLARRTEAVRAHLAATSGPRARAEAARQRTLLAGLLAEDLAVLGAPDPQQAAHDLLDALAALAAEEDRAGRVLPGARRALQGGDEPRLGLVDRLRTRLARLAAV